ncbi:hypothetical protein [Halobacteriovorax sp. HLS]|uniref:hypothetical protein n=1 Tax=Halobacteriovorax sp. HLS TaxID=2234000 RepID=UPI000FD6E286|nr:hypothetical protein [Halobacteriovorax sp. HLS]
MDKLNSQSSKEDLEKLKVEMETKARVSLNEEGLNGLLVFTLDNFAYRYLETSSCTDIHSQKKSDHHFYVESEDTDVMSILKTKDPIAKPALIQLAKKFSSTKGVGIKVKYELHCRFTELNSDNTGELECFSIINWNSDQNFKVEEGLHVKKSSKLKFSDPLILRNKLALLLEEVCEIF